VFTNGTSSVFFSFSTLTFFSPAGVDEVLADFAANFASFSRRFASFFAGREGLTRSEPMMARYEPELLEFGSGTFPGWGKEFGI